MVLPRLHFSSEIDALYRLARYFSLLFLAIALKGNMTKKTTPPKLMESAMLKVALTNLKISVSVFVTAR